ncbi:uncharacterized protein BDZ99DRAFT_486869 [Mytilinidion resinicola]|uniref:Uncharacterized protein n=1 Tax=Mytilinidion resinicola TaxID=574789 RepID=A0A6A6YW83_9PEZI|nr:uncharacterized protein BDZ99DRAFT_486869 [Mytilinidion resinicola]KAF2812245.1 hypothetical protein BDZ99DRAFT_486869 [Mytilinidion resinicola]
MKLSNVTTILLALLTPSVFTLSNRNIVQNPELLSPRQNTYAPFSGAIYIVYPNGQQVNQASTNMCPSYASVSCSSINQPSWCCPTSYTCALPSSSSGIIGCCPPNTSCGGAVNAAAVTTITVQNVVTNTPVNYQSTVYVQAYTTTEAAGGNIYNGYCSTLTENGPGLPTTRQGGCGTILIVNGADVKDPGRWVEGKGGMLVMIVVVST